MGLDTVFQNASVLAFNVFKDLAVAGSYVEVVDDGINPRTETTYAVDVIFSKLSEKELEELSFRDLIQPTDVIGLICGPNLATTVEARNLIRVDGIEYDIIAKSIDPAQALWILLLRKP